MEFKESTALEIIKKYELSEKTLKVWKTRGSIPKKYFIDGFEKRKPLSKAGIVTQKRIFSILKSEKINAKLVSELAGIHYQVLQDALRGKQSLSEQQVLILKKEINKLKTTIRTAVFEMENKRIFSDIDSQKIKEIIRLPHIVLAPLLDFKDTTDKGRVHDWRLNKQEISDSLKRQILDRLVVFVLELSI